MNLNSPWVWTGGVFGAVTITTFIFLQTAVMWLHRRESKSTAGGMTELKRPDDGVNGGAMYALVAVLGLVATYLLVKDTAWTALSIFGILAVVPYAFLQRKRSELERWKTRSSVAHSLDEMQILAVSRQDSLILDSYPWLERQLKQNTIFQKFEARLMDLIAQGLAARGDKTDLERIAREMESEDLVLFTRRTNIRSSGDDESENSLRAAEDIAGRIHLDAEITIARMTEQSIWLWLGVLTILLAAVLIPLRAS